MLSRWPKLNQLELYMIYYVSIDGNITHASFLHPYKTPDKLFIEHSYNLQDNLIFGKLLCDQKCSCDDLYLYTMYEHLGIDSSQNAVDRSWPRSCQQE